MKRVIELLRHDFPQATGVYKQSVNGQTCYCAAGYFIDVWEKETGQTFPYSHCRVYHPIVGELEFWTCHEEGVKALDKIAAYFGISKELLLHIIGMNDREQKTPQEIADYLETV